MFILIIRSERSITNVLKILLPKYNTVLVCILTSYLTPHASHLFAFLKYIAESDFIIAI